MTSRPIRRSTERQTICASDAVPDLGSLCLQVRYRGVPREAILIRHSGTVYCYLNQCVHMPRRLNCEHPRVFDSSGQYLRCSMHGIVYEPSSGVCGSDICKGRRLTALNVVEADGAIYLKDKRATLSAQPVFSRSD